MHLSRRALRAMLALAVSGFCMPLVTNAVSPRPIPCSEILTRRLATCVPAADTDLPAWVRKAGARNTPKASRVFSANKFGARADGNTDSTRAIQDTIDQCSRSGGGIVTLDMGEYITGALFLKSNVDLRI